MLALIGCSSFGDATPSPERADPAPGADAAAADASSAADATPGDAGTCNGPLELELAKFVAAPTATGSTHLAGDALEAMTMAASGTGSQAYLRLDLDGISSLTMSYDLGIAGVDGVYAEPACSVDLFADATNARPATQLYFVHADTRALSFEIATKPVSGEGVDLSKVDLGALPPNAGTHAVRLSLSSAGTRLSGTLSYDDVGHPFDVQMPGPAVRAQIHCGVYFARGAFSVSVTGFRGVACH